MMTRAFSLKELSTSPELQGRLEYLGQLIRDRREVAGLTRGQLAAMAKLSTVTVKHVETAQGAPTRRTCLFLVLVRELQLSWDDVAFVAGRIPDDISLSQGPPPNGRKTLRRRGMVPELRDGLHALRKSISSAGGHPGLPESSPTAP